MSSSHRECLPFVWAETVESEEIVSGCYCLPHLQRIRGWCTQTFHEAEILMLMQIQSICVALKPVFYFPEEELGELVNSLDDG